jgi:hypothetical protein
MDVHTASTHCTLFSFTIPSEANIIVKRPSIILSILFKNESSKVDGDFGGGGG